MCQSCGMPLSRIRGMVGRTLMDQNQKSIAVIVIKKENLRGIAQWRNAETLHCKLREMHFPAFVAKLMTANLPKLERWRENKKIRN